MIVLLALGVALAVVGLLVIADEWRRSGTQHARINGLGMRLELVLFAGLCVGFGVLMAYAGLAQ